MEEKRDIREELKDKKLLVDELPREQWKVFVWGLAEGKSIKDAYQAAYPGVKDRAATANGCRLLRKACIAAALDEIQDELGRYSLKRLKGLQDIALRVIAKAARGEHVDKIQLDAAKDILDRTGVIRREAFEHTIKGKDWADLMSSTE